MLRHLTNRNDFVAQEMLCQIKPVIGPLPYGKMPHARADIMTAPRAFADLVKLTLLLATNGTGGRTCADDPVKLGQMAAFVIPFASIYQPALLLGTMYSLAVLGLVLAFFEVSNSIHVIGIPETRLDVEAIKTVANRTGFGPAPCRSTSM